MTVEIDLDPEEVIAPRFNPENNLQGVEITEAGFEALIEEVMGKATPAEQAGIVEEFGDDLDLDRGEPDIPPGAVPLDDVMIDAGNVLFRVETFVPRKGP